MRDFAGLKTVAHFGGSCGVPADGARRLGGVARGVPADGARGSVGRRMVRGGHADSVRGAGRWFADGVRIACVVPADGPRKRQRIVGGSRQVACGWRAGPADGSRMARGDW